MVGVSEDRRHGAWGTRLYRCWKNMKTRCYNPNSADYHNYGGRGIRICKSWFHDFSTFQNWALNNGYDDKLTLDRKNVNLGYRPSNCRWVNLTIQARNRQDSCMVTTPDGDKLNINDASEKYSIPLTRMYHRYYKHGDNPDILFQKGKRSSAHFKNVKILITDIDGNKRSITEIAKIHGKSRDRIKYTHKKFGDDIHAILG